jgi:hypothetical protein
MHCLKEILDWRTSREYFYWRLKRRLGENDVIKTILKMEPSISYELASNYIQQWFTEDNRSTVRKISLSFLFNFKFFLGFAMDKRQSRCRMA